MMTILDPAIERFQTLLDMAPAQDRETMQILARPRGRPQAVR